MLGAQTIAAYSGGGGIRRGGRFAGFSAFADGPDGNRNVLPVDGESVSAADIVTAIRLNGGQLTISNDPAAEYIRVARANPSLFKVEVMSSDTRLVRITENAGGGSDWSKYLLYGGAALLGVLLITSMGRR